jgi:hypothetical protein
MDAVGSEIHIIETRDGCTVWLAGTNVLMLRLTHEEAFAAAGRLGGRIVLHDSLQSAAQDPRVARTALIA